MPAFFSNLLPEGPLRKYLAERAGVNPTRDFFLLWVLGRDLPGAIRMAPADGNSSPAVGETALRFSLAGVQLKFAAVKGAPGGLTIPANGVGGSWIAKLPSDIRVLAGRPGFSAIVIGLLGLVMSANAAVFGVVNATLLRPLPYANPDRLVMLWESYAPMKMDTMPWSDPDYSSVSAATAFDGTALFRFHRYVLTGEADSVSVRAVLAEHTLFDVLGTTAERGRLFTDADRETGAGASVVLSHATWVGRFHKNPAIVGTSILLDNQPRTVIGVLRPGLSFPPPITFGGQMLSPEPELYLPYTINRDPASRGSHSGFAVRTDDLCVSGAVAGAGLLDGAVEHATGRSRGR